MEVDSPQPPPATATATATQIKIHPLAIIGISDHQTRVTTGGSPLSSTSTSTSSTSTPPPPMIGLLFGYQKENKDNSTTISIIDSEEVEYPSSSSPEQQQIIKTKIELHEQVFPLHEVVGWYRIDISSGSAKNTTMDDDADDDDDMDVLPTEADLMINNGWMKEYNQNPLFVLMDANEEISKASSTGGGTFCNNGDEKDPKKTKNNNPRNRYSHGNTNSTSTSTSHTSTTHSHTVKRYNSKQGEEARDKLDRDEQLPLSIYETMNSDSGGMGTAVFVNVEFELETFEPERIAVEKVFQTKPKSGTSSSTSASVAAATTTATTASAAADSSKSSTTPEDGTDTTNTANTTQTISSSSSQPSSSQVKSNAGTQIQSLITSIDAMNTRIAVLLDFLHKTKNGEIPPNHALLRQVGSVVHQLPLVLGKGVFSRENDNGNGNDIYMTRRNVNVNHVEEGKMENVVLATEFENEYDDMLILSFLATIAKTTKSVLSYSARFKVMTGSSGSGSGSGNRKETGTSGSSSKGGGRYDRSYKDDI